MRGVRRRGDCLDVPGGVGAERVALRRGSGDSGVLGGAAGEAGLVVFAFHIEVHRLDGGLGDAGRSDGDLVGRVALTAVVDVHVHHIGLG